MRRLGGMMMMAVGLALLAVSVAPAGDWPQWRGPTRDGISTEANWRTDWPEDGPKRLWRRSVGRGYSSVAVSGGRVYTMGNADGKDTVYCLDAATGEVIWKHEYPSPSPKAHAGPRATPAVSDGKVYTFSRSGDVYCLRADTGEVVWSKDVQKELGVRALKWGMGGSPLVEGKLVIVAAGSGAAAMNKTDGKLVWRVDSKEAGYASPVAFSVRGKRHVAIFAGSELIIADAVDGVVRSRHPWRPKYPNNCADPIITDGKVFISSAYGAGCALLQVVDGGLLTRKPKVLWKNMNMRNHFSSCVLWKGRVYGFDGDVRRRGAALKCLNPATGEELWAHEMTGSLMLAGGKLLILTAGGELIAAEASEKGFKPLSRAKVLSGTCWTVPVLANGKIYCRNQAGDLVCLDVSAR